MNLDDWPRRATGRSSAVDRLPDEVRDQLVEARRTGSHSVSAMIAWLKHEGYEDVTRNALFNWFSTRGIDRGVA